MIKVKVLVYCDACNATAESVACIEEERTGNGCCCDRGTGRYYIDADVYVLPDGWTKDIRYSIKYFCPDHKAGR